MKTEFRTAFTFFLALQMAGPSWAVETDPFQFFQEEAKVVIATQREQTPEQAPSIVSVVTRHDIEAYGARDLADILRLVPGFEFGVDVDGLVGLSDRGIWVHEGKVLLMVNGIVQNDFGYGNYNFFGSIPASIIEKVEIIRGPGSAMYGGFAEVSVINVITHQAEHLNGMRASADIGTMGNGGSSRFGNISYGSAKNDVRMAAHVGYGVQPLSERDYTDFFGNRISLGEKNSFREWQHIIVDASAHNLSLIYHRSSLTYLGQDGFTTIFQPVNGIPQERLQDFVDTFQLKYKQALSDRLTLEPLFEYNRGSTIAAAVLPAGQVSGALEDLGASDATRYRGQLLATYDHPAIGQMTLGGGYIWDGIENVARDGTPGLQFSSNPNDTGSKGYTQSTFGLLQYAAARLARGSAPRCIPGVAPRWNRHEGPA